PGMAAPLPDALQNADVVHPKEAAYARIRRDLFFRCHLEGAPEGSMTGILRVRRSVWLREPIQDTAPGWEYDDGTSECGRLPHRLDPPGAGEQDPQAQHPAPAA